MVSRAINQSCQALPSRQVLGSYQGLADGGDGGGGPSEEGGSGSGAGVIGHLSGPA